MGHSFSSAKAFLFSLSPFFHLAQVLYHREKVKDTLVTNYTDTRSLMFAELEFHS